MKHQKEKAADRLKHLREKVLGMNQIDFAASAGVSHRSVSNIEAGDEAPRAMSELVRNLQLSENWLKTGEGSRWLTGSDEENVARIKSMKSGPNSQPATNEAYEQVKSERDRLYKDNEFFKQLLSDLSQTYKALAGKSFRSHLRKVPGGI